MRNARRYLAESMNVYFGFNFEFYKSGQYWCYHISEIPRFPFQQYSFQTNLTTLNYKNKDNWVRIILSALEDETTRYLLDEVRKHHAKMWAESPMKARVHDIPKPETEECEMSTQTETKTEGKPALNRYRLRVVEAFEIYVDAADEEAAKAFIEEGVPQMQHAAFQCHDREYTVKECEPMEEDKSCRKLYATVSERKRAQLLETLKYFVRKRKQYEYKGQVIPKYWKQFQYWDARLTKGANRFARDYGYLPSVISDHLRETTDFCWDY
jgi:hypothetical protein